MVTESRPPGAKPLILQVFVAVTVLPIEVQPVAAQIGGLGKQMNSARV